MTLEECIRRFENYSKCIQQTLISKEEAENVCDWLRELKAYKEAYEEIKDEINNIDSMTFIGSGSGCASEMRSECLSVIDRCLEEGADDT